MVSLLDNIQSFFTDSTSSLMDKLVMLSPTIIILITIVWFINYKVNEIREKKFVHKELTDLAKGVSDLTVDDFFLLKETSKKVEGNTEINKSGVYILHNERDDLYYVGQATRLAERVTKHFSGLGNGDVYADYKYGAEFTIKLIPIQTTQFDTLNELERYYIAYYDSYENGYNRTRGNKG